MKKIILALRFLVLRFLVLRFLVLRFLVLRKAYVVGAFVIHAFAFLILVSTAQEAYARCRAFIPEKEIPKIPLIVEATVIAANNDKHELSSCAGEADCFLKAKMSIDRILKGNTAMNGFSTAYAYRHGCPGVNTFKTGEKRIFFLNADGSLYGKSCGFSGAPLTGDYANTIRKIIKNTVGSTS